MRWFLDMCILIYYSSQDGGLFYKKTVKFLDEKKQGSFLVCFYIIKRDMPKYLRRQNIIINEVLKKIKNGDYELGKSEEGSLLYERDRQKAGKLFLQSETVKDKLNFIVSLRDSQKGQEIAIKKFIKTKAEKVIQLSEIDMELKSQLLTFSDNNASDANVLASGIQEHNKKDVILVTADKQHWTKENLEWAVPEASPLHKKYSKIPEIRYIQDF